MAAVLMKSMFVAGLGAYAENKYMGNMRGPTTSSGIDGLSPLSFAAPSVLLGVGFYTLVHGFEVGKARNKYMALAEKDGESDVELRYGLPNLYAQGTSKHARAFNAVQRSHQHILETYPFVVLGGLLATYQFPICATLSTLTYAVGRVILSDNYAKSGGDASKRYTNPLARFMWYGLLTTFFLGMASGIKTVVMSS
jgi:hypothetical protein